MGMWILIVLLGLPVAIVGVLVSLGFMSGREHNDQKVACKWKLMHRPLRLKC